MNVSNASDVDLRATSRNAGITRRGILRALVPAAAAAAGVSCLLEETGATGSNVFNGHGFGNGRDRDRDRDRGRDRDRDRGTGRRGHHDRDREAGHRADRGRRPDREPNPDPGPGSGATPAPAPPQELPAIQVVYGFDPAGTLAIYGEHFAPGVPVSLHVYGDWSDWLGAYLLDFTAGTIPDAAGEFTVINNSLCPSQLTVQATQAGSAPVFRNADFGLYLCQVTN